MSGFALGPVGVMRVFCTVMSGWEQARSVYHVDLPSSVLEHYSDLTLFLSF